MRVILEVLTNNAPLGRQRGGAKNRAKQFELPDASEKDAEGDNMLFEGRRYALCGDKALHQSLKCWSSSFVKHDRKRNTNCQHTS